MTHRPVAALAAATLLGLAGAPLAHGAALPPRSSFTVVTSFLTPTSEIVEATGAWAGCTEVSDLTSATNQVGPRTVQFSGEKLVSCPGGDVVIHYEAEMSTSGPDSRDRRTFGTWSVVSSEDGAPVVGGGGRVEGVTRGCPDCIVDTFSGRVY